MFERLPDEIIFDIFAMAGIVDSWAMSLVCMKLRGLFLRHHKRLEGDGNIRAKFYKNILSMFEDGYGSQKYLSELLQIPETDCLEFAWRNFANYSRFDLKRRRQDFSGVARDIYKSALSNLSDGKISRKEAILLYEFIHKKYYCKFDSAEFLIYDNRGEKNFTLNTFEDALRYGSFEILVEFTKYLDIKQMIKYMLATNIVNERFYCYLFVGAINGQFGDLAVDISGKLYMFEEIIIMIIESEYPLTRKIADFVHHVSHQLHSRLVDRLMKLADDIRDDKFIDLFCILLSLIEHRYESRFYMLQTLRYYQTRGVRGRCNICGKTLAEHEIE